MKNILLMALILPTLLLSACTTERVTVTAPPPPPITTTVTAPPITVTSPPITVTAPTVTAIPPTVTVTVTPPPITITAPPITITVTPPPPAELYIITENLSYRIMETSTNYWDYSWQISIKNMTCQTLALYIELQFLDADGFIVEWTNDIVEFNSQEEKTLRGTAMVDVAIAANIVSAVADIEIF